MRSCNVCENIPNALLTVLMKPIDIMLTVRDGAAYACNCELPGRKMAEVRCGSGIVGRWSKNQSIIQGKSV